MRNPLHLFTEDLDEVLRDLGIDEKEVQDSPEEGEEENPLAGTEQASPGNKIDNSFKLRLLGLAKKFDEAESRLRELVVFKPSVKRVYGIFTRLRRDFLFYLDHLNDYDPDTRQELFNEFKSKLKKVLSSLG